MFFGIDTAGYRTVVEAAEVLVEEVDVLVYLLFGDHEAEILVGLNGARFCDITRIVFVEEGAERGGQVEDRELTHQCRVEFIAEYGDHLVGTPSSSTPR